MNNWMWGTLRSLPTKADFVYGLLILGIGLPCLAVTLCLVIRGAFLWAVGG